MKKQKIKVCIRTEGTLVFDGDKTVLSFQIPEAEDMVSVVVRRKDR